MKRRITLELVFLCKVRNENLARNPRKNERPPTLIGFSMSLNRKLLAFYRRIKSGQVMTAFYLAYYYSYLYLYDFSKKTNFADSQTAKEGGVPDGGTGNFPAHPVLVRKYLRAAALDRDDKILDVGHGCGVVLDVASRMGFKDLTGVEYSDIAYKLSQKNIGRRAKLIHGNAIDLDLSPYNVIFFFSPFRGELAKQFFEKVAASSVRVILTINHDPKIEPILLQNYRLVYQYQHFLYRNFNCKIWVRELMQGPSSFEK